MPETSKINELITQCVAFLSARDIIVEKVETPYVLFNYTILGRNFQCVFTAGEGDDPNFIRFVIPNIEIGNDINEITPYLNQLTADYKVGKAFLSENNQLWLGVECFVYSKENLSLLYERMFNTMEHLCTAYLVRNLK